MSNLLFFINSLAWLLKSEAAHNGRAKNATDRKMQCQRVYPGHMMLAESTTAPATRFTLYGSPHSLPTYKVALTLRLSGAPFAFRYVSF